MVDGEEAVTVPPRCPGTALISVNAVIFVIAAVICGGLGMVAAMALQMVVGQHASAGVYCSCGNVACRLRSDVRMHMKPCPRNAQSTPLEELQ